MSVTVIVAPATTVERRVADRRPRGRGRWRSSCSGRCWFPGSRRPDWLSSAFASRYHVPGATAGSATVVVPALAAPASSWTDGPRSGQPQVARVEREVRLTGRSRWSTIRRRPPPDVLRRVGHRDRGAGAARAGAVSAETTRSGPTRSRTERVLLVSVDSGDRVAVIGDGDEVERCRSARWPGSSRSWSPASSVPGRAGRRCRASSGEVSRIERELADR